MFNINLSYIVNSNNYFRIIFDFRMRVGANVIYKRRKRKEVKMPEQVGIFLDGLGSFGMLILKIIELIKPTKKDK